jgi:hypothetical protein
MEPTVTSNDLRSIYHDNHTLVAGAVIVTGLGLLLLITLRLARLTEHRLTLLVANLLTIVAAALATMVSASGMWKFFTDVLGPSPLRIAFFAYIEVAQFASALLARARLLREPEKGTTGVDGAAVWILAALTASLASLDASSFREVCLRLVAPLVAAWMWERALAAERSARLGSSMSRIHWAVTIERVLVWVRLAEPRDRDVSEIDRAHRRARLARARLRLHLLREKKAADWRIHRAHHQVIRYAMQAAEHFGLADFPHVADEREAMQMYMATVYGVVEATSPVAVKRFNAWRLNAGDPMAPNGSHDLDRTSRADFVAHPPVPPTGEPSQHSRPSHPRDLPPAVSDDADAAPHHDDQPRSGVISQTPTADFDTSAWSAETSGRGRRAQPRVQPHDFEDASGDDAEDGDEEADRTSVAAMRRFWDSEIAHGRIPSGAELSRAAGVPPSTGLGRRKRREWQADLPHDTKVTTTASR